MIFWYQSWLEQTSESYVLYFLTRKDIVYWSKKIIKKKVWHIGIYTKSFSFLVQLVSEILISKVTQLKWGGSTIIQCAVWHWTSICYFLFIQVTDLVLTDYFKMYSLKYQIYLMTFLNLWWFYYLFLPTIQGFFSSAFSERGFATFLLLSYDWMVFFILVSKFQ